jgi:hypothetical protein
MDLRGIWSKWFNIKTSFVPPQDFLGYGLAFDIVPTAYIGTDNQHTTQVESRLSSVSTRID